MEVCIQVTYNTLLRARSRYGSLQEVRQCLAIYQDMRKAGYVEPVCFVCAYWIWALNFPILWNLYLSVLLFPYPFILLLHSTLHHRYSSNDYFLKELLEEWCEGVIKNSELGPVQMTYPSCSSGKAKTDKSQSLLLEKIAVLLQKDFVKGSSVDLRGLSKVRSVSLFYFLHAPLKLMLWCHCVMDMV